MSKKSTTSFNLDKAISRIAKPSVFDRIVKEIDAIEVPAKYIDHIQVQYQDGNTIELNGKDITQPIPMSKTAQWREVEDSYKKMKDVKVFINTEKLEEDVNRLVEELIGKYC